MSHQHFRQHGFQRYISQLALFTMLLLYVAPLVSMSVVMARHAPLMQNSSAMSVTMRKTAMRNAMSPSSMSHHDQWCQYCDLLATLHGSTHCAQPMPACSSQFSHPQPPHLREWPTDNRTALHRPRAPPEQRSLPLV